MSSGRSRLGSRREWSFGRDVLLLGWCAGHIWIGMGVVSQRIDRFEMSEMLQSD